MLTNIFEHWKTTAAGIIIAAVWIAGVLMQHGYAHGRKGMALELIAAVAVAVLGGVAKDPNAVRAIAIIGLGLGLIVGARAQATTPAPLTPGVFSLSGQAIGIMIGGQVGAGADSIEALTVTNTVQLEGHEIIAPAINFSGYFGGVRWAPDLRPWIQKTKLPADMFQIYFHGAPGVVRNGGAGDMNHFALFAGGGVNYAPAGNGAFTVQPVRFDYLNAPGFGASPHGWMVSAGMSYVWGK